VSTHPVSYWPLSFCFWNIICSQQELRKRLLLTSQYLLYFSSVVRGILTFSWTPCTSSFPSLLCHHWWSIRCECSFLLDGEDMALFLPFLILGDWNGDVMAGVWVVMLGTHKLGMVEREMQLTELPGQSLTTYFQTFFCMTRKWFSVIFKTLLNIQQNIITIIAILMITEWVNDSFWVNDSINEWVCRYLRKSLRNKTVDY
jgi:hypothetical protein